MILSDEGSTLKTSDFTVRISSTPTFFYFDLYKNKTIWFDKFLTNSCITYI